MRAHIRPYLPSLFAVVRGYWPDALHATLELVARIATALKDEFKVRVRPGGHVDAVALQGRGD